MTTQLTFRNVALTAIQRNNQTYISASDLACALQYADASSVVRIYSRNEDEFTADMSDTVKLTVSGNLETTARIFSLRGAHLIAMFARTPVAKDFRKWVLDILDREARQPQQLALPEPEKKFILELTEKELKKLCWLWKMAELMRQLIGMVQKPLELLGSRLSGSAWGFSHEYKYPIEIARKILVRATKDIQTDKIDSNGWNNVIHELRRGETNGTF